MSTARLNAIKSRLVASTPGPWHYPAKPGGLYVCFGNIQENGTFAAVTHEQNETALFRPNMEFIANAPSDLALLLERDRIFTEALESMTSAHGVFDSVKAWAQKERACQALAAAEALCGDEQTAEDALAALKEQP